MAVTYASFVALFPSFATDVPAEQDRITAYIGLASNSVPSSVWGIWTDEGISYLTAHMLTTANQAGSGGGGGPVVEARVDRLTKKFGFSAAMAMSENGLMNTPYGQRYLQLRSQLSLTPMVI